MGAGLFDDYARQLGVPADELAATVRALSKNPVAWIEAATGSRLWSKQREIAWSVIRNRNTVVPSCNGAGKSFIAGAINAFGVNNYDGFLGLTTAPTDRQVKQILWAEIRRIYTNQRLPLAGTPDMTQLLIDEDHRLIGFATSDTNQNAFQGIRARHTWITLDEACGISPIIYEGAKSILAAGSGRLLQLSNPVDPTSTFYEECQRSENTVIQLSAYDTPNFNIPECPLREQNFTAREDDRSLFWKHVLAAHGYFDWNANNGHGECVNLPSPCTSPQFVHDIVQGPGGTSNPMYVVRVLGLFPDSNEFGAFTLPQLEDAMRAQLPSEAPLELGVDVARFGDNKTVVCGWQDPQLRVLDAWAKLDTAATADRIVEIATRCARHGLAPQAVKVDVIGVGGGVVDNLRRRHVEWPGGRRPFPVVAFNSSSTEGIPDDVENARGHAYLSLARRAEERTLDLPARGQLGALELRKELLSIRKRILDGSGKIKIMGKEWMREQGLASPDYADAAVIAAYQGPRGSTRDYGITF